MNKQNPKIDWNLSIRVVLEKTFNILYSIINNSSSIFKNITQHYSLYSLMLDWVYTKNI